MSRKIKTVIADELAKEINSFDEKESKLFNDLYTRTRMDRYFAVIDAKPEKINNLNGWYNRIKKFYSSPEEFDDIYKNKKTDYFNKYRSYYTGK